MEDSCCSFLRRDYRPDDLDPDYIEQGQEQDSTDYYCRERPQRRRSRRSARSKDSFSIGEMNGSIVVRQKRAMGLKGLIFLVRTAQSRTQIAPNTTAMEKSAVRSTWITASAP